MYEVLLKFVLDCLGYEKNEMDPRHPSFRPGRAIMFTVLVSGCVMAWFEFLALDKNLTEQDELREKVKDLEQRLSVCMVDSFNEARIHLYGQDKDREKSSNRENPLPADRPPQPPTPRLPNNYSLK